VTPGKVQRKILLAAELYRRQHGQSPTWAELRHMLGVDQSEIRGRIRSLERNGFVSFTTEPRSLRVTAEGLRAALNGKKAVRP
jgi:DNA-binding MarR family transcriptional regulator